MIRIPYASRGFWLALFLACTTSTLPSSQFRGSKTKSTQNSKPTSEKKPSKPQKLGMPLAVFAVMTFVTILLFYRYRQKVNLELELDHVQDQITEAQKALDKEEKQYETTQGAIKQSEQDIQEMEETVAGLVVEEEKLEEAQQKLVEELDKVTRETAQLTQDRTTTQEKIRQTQQMIDSIEAQIQDISNSLGEPFLGNRKKKLIQLRRTKEMVRKKLVILARMYPKPAT